MKSRILRAIKTVVALCVAVLCFLAFFKHTYLLKFFDIQFVAAVQSSFITVSVISLILLAFILILTLIFGRIYCSMLCPLGIFQDFLMFLFKPFYKKRSIKAQKHHLFAYFFAAILFGMVFGGTVFLLRLFDPYSIAGNALSGATYGIIFISVLAVLVFFKKRFFCTNICPVGAVLGIISRFSLFKIRLDAKKCKMCSLCARICPTGSIDYENHKVDNETCIKCFKCLTHCQHHAINYSLPESKPQPFSPKRRQLIIGGTCLALLGVAYKSGLYLSQFIAEKIKKVIIPAGSGKLSNFANRCLNCNLCVKNCPMKIIKPATKDVPFVHLDYGKKYCNYDCHKCSEVCPSGAIKRISLEEKRRTKIATAVVHTDTCIQCGLCVHECPRKIIVKEFGDFPQIDADKCIGCGACASMCPVKAIAIEPVDEQIILS